MRYVREAGDFHRLAVGEVQEPPAGTDVGFLTRQGCGFCDFWRINTSLLDVLICCACFF